MLPAAARLRRSDDFRAVSRRGRRSARTPLTLQLLETSAAGPARVGFVVGRANGGAVVRNQLRRRLRHLMGARLHQLAPGACLVVRAAPGAAELSSAELAGRLDAALSRLPAESS